MILGTAREAGLKAGFAEARLQSVDVYKDYPVKWVQAVMWRWEGAGGQGFGFNGLTAQSSGLKTRRGQGPAARTKQW